MVRAPSSRGGKGLLDPSLRLLDREEKVNITFDKPPVGVHRGDLVHHPPVEGIHLPEVRKKHVVPQGSFGIGDREHRPRGVALCRPRPREKALPQVDPRPFPSLPEGIEQAIGEAVEERQGMFLLPAAEKVLPVTGSLADDEIDRLHVRLEEVAEVEPRGGFRPSIAGVAGDEPWHVAPLVHPEGSLRVIPLVPEELPQVVPGLPEGLVALVPLVGLLLPFRKEMLHHVGKALRERPSSFHRGYPRRRGKGPGSLSPTGEGGRRTSSPCGRCPPRR